MLPNSTELQNKVLFELEKFRDLKIDADLAAFLNDKVYPWACLSKSLTEFIRAFVEKIEKTRRHLGSISPQAHLENAEEIVVCEGAVIEPFAFVQGPCYIGPGASVRHGAYVRGSVYAGAGAVIGHTSEVKGSILLPQAKAAHFAYVGDSILGADCNLGAGTKLANLRFDHGQITLRVGDGNIESGLKKFGAILGNRAQTGCNSVTNPGTILLPGAMVLPCSNARGIVRARG